MLKNESMYIKTNYVPRWTWIDWPEFFVNVRKETSVASQPVLLHSQNGIDEVWLHKSTGLWSLWAKTGTSVLESMCHFQADQVTVLA